MRVGRYFRIGRLAIVVGPYAAWGSIEGSCGCKIWGLGRFEITWFDKTCKCRACGSHICKCKDAV